MKNRLLWLACAGLLSAPVASASTPTYSKDVAPILNARCVGCHRPGEIGPMPLTSYSEVRPFAKAIRDAVAEHKMPPWHADPKIGHFANDRRLSDEQVKTILQWVNAGAPEGNPRDMPAAPKFTEGWTIGKPDIVFQIPHPFEVPAEGVVDYQYMTIPTNFTEDRWVSGLEVRPGNRAVLHHVIAFLLPPANQAKPNTGIEKMKWGTQCPEARPDAAFVKRYVERLQKGIEPRELGSTLVGWAPGGQGALLPPGEAKLIPAGSRIMFQLHYTPNGKPAVDSETKVGLIFTHGDVDHVVESIPVANLRIDIPAEDPNYAATSCFTFNQDTTLLAMTPHMHYRGKDFTFKVTFPDGRSETLLSVPNYDFGWQTSYRLAEPLKLPAGSRIDCTAHYDNSARNKFNPDSSKEVKWGDQTFEEMMIGYITIATKAERVPAASASATNH